MKLKVNSLEILKDCLSRSSQDDFSLDDVSQQFDGYLNVFTISGSVDPYDLLALDQNDYLKVAEIFYRSLGSGNRRDKLVAAFQEMAESAVKGQSLGVFTVEVSRSERVSFNTDKIPTFYQQVAECLLYRSSWKFKESIGYSNGAKKFVLQSIEGDSIPVLRKTIKPLLNYRNKFVLSETFAKRSLELREQAEKERDELSDFDFSALGKLIDQL